MEYAWTITYQIHDVHENFGISHDVVYAESIGLALKIWSNTTGNELEKLGYSDYHVTSINIVPELH